MIEFATVLDLYILFFLGFSVFISKNILICVFLAQWGIIWPAKANENEHSRFIGQIQLTKIWKNQVFLNMYIPNLECNFRNV